MIRAMQRENTDIGLKKIPNLQPFEKPRGKDIKPYWGGHGYYRSPAVTLMQNRVIKWKK